MRFIHAADLHIDSPLRGLSRYEGAPLAQLRGATRRALERLVELAIDERVDLVLIAGDLYDRDWPDFHTGLFVREQMVRLARHNIRVFMVQGNHDAQGVITRQLSWPDNVKVFSHRKAETVCLDALGIAIHGQSFSDREMPDDLVPGYPPALPGYFNIGLLHTSLTGLGHDTYAPTTLAVLKTRGYDYWALGHIHARQLVCEQPRVVFPGNLQGRHARETGPKGCELVELQGASLREARFVPLDVVRWQQIHIDLKPVQTLADLSQHLTRALQAAVAGPGCALHAVRILLTGETALQALEALQPGTLAAAVQAAAQDLAAADIWIEQVKLDLRSPVDRVQMALGDDALGELVRLVDVLATDEPLLAEFCRGTLAEVLAKVPPEVHAALALDGGSQALPRLDDMAGLLALVKYAEATLLARLNATEVAA